MRAKIPSLAIQGGNVPDAGAIIKEVPYYHASKNYNEMYAVQAKKLQHNEKQEKYSGQIGNEQILSFLSQAYLAQ